jgi:hypothetical protein
MQGLLTFSEDVAVMVKGVLKTKVRHIMDKYQNKILT